MLCYEFYKTQYHGGSIPASDWPAYEAKAAAQLAKYKRIYHVSAPCNSEDAESMAVCAMADALYGFDIIANGEGGPVSSASIGSVSVGYGNAATQAVDMSPAGQARAIYDAARLYLDIYRGVG